MTSTHRLSAETRRLLRCPSCRAALADGEERLVCTGERCAAAYPIIDGVPILINEANSLFSADDFLEGRQTTAKKASSWHRWLWQHLPTLGHTAVSAMNYRHLVELLLHAAARPRVLIVGGGMLGTGMDVLATHPAIELVESDVYRSRRTALIFDAHDVPFADGSFDGVIAQAVLEHVVDPYRCVAEIHRVLKPNGLVYAETPFMQQVHGGRYDFTRFTPLGHRRLFRRFTAVAAGTGGGPGSVMGWSYLYFLVGFARTRRTRAMATVLARLTGFWWKYFDRAFTDRPGAQDGAWGSYFLGRKSDQTLSDRALIQQYGGLS